MTGSGSTDAFPHTAPLTGTGTQDGVAPTSALSGTQAETATDTQMDAATEIVERERVSNRSIYVRRGRAGQGVGRAHRLRSARDFQRTRSRGRRVSGRLLSLFYTRQPTGAETSATRVGYVVGKRVGKAVVRNIVKRRLREAMRRQLSHYPRGWDIIVSARPEAAQADYTTLDSELKSLCERAQLSKRRDLRGTE